MDPSPFGYYRSYPTPDRETHFETSSFPPICRPLAILGVASSLLYGSAWIGLRALTNVPGSPTALGLTNGFASNLIVVPDESGEKIYALGNFEIDETGEVGTKGLPSAQWSPSILKWENGTWSRFNRDTKIAPLHGTCIQQNGTHYLCISSNEIPSSISLFNEEGISHQIGLIEGSVGALIQYGEDLIVAGKFVAVNGVPAQNIAAWDGTTWRELGGGVHEKNGDARVFCLNEYQGNLIVGGIIDQAGSTPVLGLAAWTGSEWKRMPFSNSVNPSAPFAVNHLAIKGAKLIAAQCYYRTSLAAAGFTSHALAEYDEDQVENIPLPIQPRWIYSMNAAGSDLLVSMHDSITKELCFMRLDSSGNWTSLDSWRVASSSHQVWDIAPSIVDPRKVYLSVNETQNPRTSTSFDILDAPIKVLELK